MKLENMRRCSRPKLILAICGLLRLTGCTMYGVVEVSEPALEDGGDKQIFLKDDVILYPGKCSC